MLDSREDTFNEWLARCIGMDNKNCDNLVSLRSFIIGIVWHWITLRDKNDQKQPIRHPIQTLRSILEASHLNLFIIVPKMKRFFQSTDFAFSMPIFALLFLGPSLPRWQFHQIILFLPRPPSLIFSTRVSDGNINLVHKRPGQQTTC